MLEKSCKNMVRIAKRKNKNVKILFFGKSRFN